MKRPDAEASPDADANHLPQSLVSDLLETFGSPVVAEAIWQLRAERATTIAKGTP